MSETETFTCAHCDAENTEAELEANVWLCPKCEMPVTGTTSGLAREYDELAARYEKFKAAVIEYIRAVETEQSYIVRPAYEKLRPFLQASASTWFQDSD